MTYDIHALAAANPRVHALTAPLGLQSLCSLPLMTSRGHLGILTVGARKDAEFGPAEVQALKDVSTQIAIAAENTLAFDEIRRLRDLLLSEKRYLEDELRERHDFREIVGQSGTLRRALQQVDTVAATDATVLLTGETGTGKELVARAIHERSPRRGHSFVRVNCAAIPATLIESEMFGHERGAFTGAVERAAGPVRGRQSRHAVPRRGRRSAARGAAEAAARDSGEGDRAAGIDVVRESRRPAHRGHQPRSLGRWSAPARSATICSTG